MCSQTLALVSWETLEMVPTADSRLPAGPASHPLMDWGPETELTTSQTQPVSSWLWGYLIAQTEAGPPPTASVSPSVMEELNTSGLPEHNP